MGVGVGIFKAFSGGANAAVAAKIIPFNPTTVMSEDQMREVLFAPPEPLPPTIHEEKQKAVDEYRARYYENPEDPDAEALLRAMGNLYKQTGDFKNAAWAYGQFLKRFPNSPGKSAVYMELSACYELLKETDNLSRLYLEMMNNYAPDSNEYKYAEASLRISRLELNQRDPNVTPPRGPEGTFTVETLPDGAVRYLDSVRKPGVGVLAPAGRPAS